MSSFELEMTLSEFGIDAPDKCKACPRLGSLVTKLSTAQDNKTFLTASSNKETYVANASAQLSQAIRERYPGVTDEQVSSTVESSIARHLESEKYTNFLKQTGELIEIEDNTIAATLNEVTAVLGDCPPNGCPVR